MTKYRLPRSSVATARTPRVLANLGWGIRYGLVFATLLSILVVVVNGLHSELSLSGRTFPTVQIVLGYLVAGALAGIVVGALRDRASTRAQKVLNSGIVGVVAYVVVSTSVLGLSGATILAGAIPGAIVGLLAGVALHTKDRA